MGVITSLTPGAEARQQPVNKSKEKNPQEVQNPKQSRFSRPIGKDKPESSKTPQVFDIMATETRLLRILHLLKILLFWFIHRLSSSIFTRCSTRNHPHLRESFGWSPFIHPLFTGWWIFVVILISASSGEDLLFFFGEWKSENPFVIFSRDSRDSTARLSFPFGFLL